MLLAAITCAVVFGNSANYFIVQNVKSNPFFSFDKYIKKDMSIFSIVVRIISFARISYEENSQPR